MYIKHRLPVKSPFRHLIAGMILALIAQPVLGQKGVGLRLASNINYFPRSQEFGLVQSGFTSGVLGVFWSSYNEFRGAEIGLNVMHKARRDGGFRLPVVMADFDPAQDVGMTAVEMDVKVGPRFGAWNPKIGYVFGYLFQTEGILRPGLDFPANRLYLQLPFGMSFNLPTNFGSVGFGSYYYVGVLNVLKNPGTGAGSSYSGGRWRAVNLEFTVTFDTR